MGIIQDTANILDKTARVLNEAAFGDIRNIFNNKLYGLKTRPIGLYMKSYDFMLEHLYRNIGNAEYVYDGYNTPIGELANPYYNYHTRIPWFYKDTYKNRTANYLEYIRETYGAALSVENINEFDFFHIDEDASSVGYVDGAIALESLDNNTFLLPTPNGTGRDSHLGVVSGYYNGETLLNAVKANDNRLYKYKNGITDGLNDNLGVNSKNVTDNKTYLKLSVDEDTGRLADDIFSPLLSYDNPVDTSNYGHYSDIGSYMGYYNSLTDKAKGYFEDNVYAKGKLYYPTIRSNSDTILNGKTYLGKIGISIGHDRIKPNNSGFLDAVAVDELQIRYIFATQEENSNISNAKNGGVYVYTEEEDGSSTNIPLGSYNAGVKFGYYTSYQSGELANDLLRKTNESFKNGEYKTLIARFHTKSTDVENTDTTQTAISEKYGMSHGRNLLKVNPDKSEGYDNPYCRVWTFHHQYHRLKDAIRPLEYGAEELYSKYNFSAFTADHSDYGFENGRVRLEKHGTLNKKNGLVNITPIDTHDVSRKVDIKNCMFSIENLAWKDAFSTDAKSRASFQAGGLSAEQKGPFGGRIMWFPPYDLKFGEDISVNWNENSFIGRGENIYTYVNTMRSGNLSFKLLVDHPSIIDYWENRGKSVSNSVDEVDDPEQMLLRFFAGCDMLTSKSVTKPISQPPINDRPTPSPETLVLKFFVFYPNNYSGVDDDVDFAMKYLTNGLGAGKTKNANNATVDYQVPYSTVSNPSGYGGYEMRAGKPISIVGGQEIGNKKIGNATFGNDTTTLYVQEGDSTNTWWQRKWYYRVDKAYKNQELLKKNYLDRNSYCLNSKAGLSQIAKSFSITDTDNLYSFADVYVALEGGEAITVLNGLYSQSKVNDFLSKIKQYTIDHVECIGRASQQGYKPKNATLQKNRAMTVKRWLSKSNLFDISKIKATTGGTGGGDVGVNNGDESAINNKLWRCAEVNIHIKKTTSDTVQNKLTENITPLTTSTGEELHQNNYLFNNSYDNYLNSNELIVFTDASENDNYRSAIKDRVKSIKMKHLSDNINELAFNLRHSVENGNVNLNRAWDAIADFSDHDNKFQYDEYGYIYERGKGSFYDDVIDLHDEEKNIIGNTSNNIDNDIVSGYNTRQGGSDTDKVVRYDNESKFFSMLEKEEPILHHKISDKIKYFDPAFHSISPEGFNARLTFLQQCTRQGPTIGSSDNYTENNTANNLSFGRPPVCILRIGDFYYTKILIESLTFSFDPLVWDLNTEGIGVMPMICDINIRFKFIGGSSLAGHITRLQNALSFNYYANTEVYDNRSELAEYDENGNIVKFKPYNPNV